MARTRLTTAKLEQTESQHAAWVYWEIFILSLLLAIALPAKAQIQVGDNLNMNLNGVMGGGYSGVFGDPIPSSHGLDFSGNGTLTGSYYNPNFLSFSLSPYYGQSRQNSEFLSLFKGGGFDFNSNIFAGSHFPGSVGFSKEWNSEGSFGLPGQPNYTTEGSGQGFSIGWSALIPNYPTLTAIFNTTNNDYSVLGTGQSGNGSSKHFGLNSGYTIAGFSLNGFYNIGTSNSNTPQVSGSQAMQNVTSDDNSFGGSVTHHLPMSGTFSSSFSRSYMNTDYLGYHFDGTVDTVNANAGFHPTQKLSFSLASGYNDNLTASLFQLITSGTGQQPQSVDQAGGIFQNTQESSHSFYVSAYSNYLLTKKLQLNGEVERRQQSFEGTGYTSNLYGGGASYVDQLFGGFLAASLNVIGSNSDYIQGNVLSFTTNVSYSRTFSGWAFNGSFSYAQNVQTVLITSMDSFYNYSGSIRYRPRQGLVWTATAAGSRSALTNQPNTGNSSQSYSTSLASRHLSVNASYAKADGFGLLGAGQIQPVPPGGIPPDWLIIYGGHSYSFGLGTMPIRNLSFGASFSRAFSDTNAGGVGSDNKTSQLNLILHYRMRKLMFNAGYGRLVQGFSASGLPPANVNSFSAGLSRSFNFF